MYAVAVVLLSALAAPWAYLLAQWLGTNIHAAAWLARQPFRRIFDRCVLVTALAGLLPLLRAADIRSCAALGYVRADHWWRHALLGFFLGIVSFLVAGLLLMALGARTWKEGIEGSTLISSMAKFTVTAIVVALIEETLFRGGLQGVLQRRGRVPLAIAITSAVYSIIHFLKPQTASIAASAITWLSGFQYLGQVLGKSFIQPGVAAGFVTLWLAGCVLGLAFAETKGLYLSMGLHAGWVLTLKSYSFCTAPVIMTEPAWWIGNDLITSPAIWPVLVVLFFGVLWLCRNKLRPLR